MDKIEFKSGYGRVDLMWLEEIECDSCHTTKTCLCIDYSEGEYRPGRICQECAAKFFESASVRTMQQKDEEKRIEENRRKEKTYLIVDPLKTFADAVGKYYVPKLNDLLGNKSDRKE